MLKRLKNILVQCSCQRMVNNSLHPWSFHSIRKVQLIFLIFLQRLSSIFCRQVLLCTYITDYILRVKLGRHGIHLLFSVYYKSSFIHSYFLSHRPALLNLPPHLIPPSLLPPSLLLPSLLLSIFLSP